MLVLPAAVAFSRNQKGPSKRSWGPCVLEKPLPGRQTIFPGVPACSLSASYQRVSRELNLLPWEYGGCLPAHTISRAHPSPDCLGGVRPLGPYCRLCPLNSQPGGQSWKDSRFLLPSHLPDLPLAPPRWQGRGCGPQAWGSACRQRTGG